MGPRKRKRAKLNEEAYSNPGFKYQVIYFDEINEKSFCAFAASKIKNRGPIRTWKVGAKCGK